MDLGEFLDQFRNREVVIDIDDENFDENSEIVGDWLDDNFEFPPYDADHFRDYFKSIQGHWQYVFYKKESGCCPAANSGWLSYNGNPRRILLSEVRRMIENYIKNPSDPAFESAFEEVFM